jgi:hypothetical protein
LDGEDPHAHFEQAKRGLANWLASSPGASFEDLPAFVVVDATPAEVRSTILSRLLRAT